jgi:hypothetical protein
LFLAPQCDIQSPPFRYWSRTWAAYHHRRVGQVLERENNWASWKRERCPDFARPSTGPDALAGDKRKMLERAEEAAAGSLDRAENRWKRRFFHGAAARDFVPAAVRVGDLREACRPKDREDPERPERSAILANRLQVRLQT